MIGKDALIKAIRIASGSGGVTPPNPADLRLYWDIDDSDLSFFQFEEQGLQMNAVIKEPNFEEQVMKMYPVIQPDPAKEEQGMQMYAVIPSDSVTI